MLQSEDVHHSADILLVPDSQISLWNSNKQGSLLGMHSFADWGCLVNVPLALPLSMLFTFAECIGEVQETCWTSSASSVILPGWLGAWALEPHKLEQAQKSICTEGNLTVLCGNSSWDRRLCTNLTQLSLSWLFLAFVTSHSESIYSNSAWESLSS